MIGHKLFINIYTTSLSPVIFDWRTASKIVVTCFLKNSIRLLYLQSFLTGGQLVK